MNTKCPMWSEFLIFIEKSTSNSQDIFIDSNTSVFRETKSGISPVKYKSYVD